jgi:hypothetical protein
MTHPPDVVAAALELSRSGQRPTAIARLLNVPRRTVADWVEGRAPRLHVATTSPPRSSDLPVAYAYLLGLYLGDGCLSPHPRGVFKLRITLDMRYPGVVGECERAMAEVMPASRVCKRMTPDHCFEVYSYSKRWPLFFPQHGPGKKHLRAIVLDEWQRDLVARWPQLLLRGLIHSDGCRFVNTGRNWSNPRYAFSNRSENILQIFRDACDLIGVRSTNAPHTVYVSRKADVARLDQFIGPKT